MSSSVVELLLVEDNPSDLELTLHSFARNNLLNRVQVARDGEEALQYLFGTGPWAGRHPEDGPKVIFLDLKLPKVDGLEVLRQLRKDPRTRLIPVVVVTSSQEERDIVESYQLGVNSYVVKPLDFEQFANAVQQIGLYWLLMNRTPT